MKSKNDSIPLFKAFLAPENELLPRLKNVLYSGQLSEGEPVYLFERDFSRYIGLPNTLSFYSGTAALHTALILAGVGPKDEVISTPMTAEPTNMAICHAGGTIVWADVDPENGNVSPTSIAERITPRTRAIMVVHYGGIPASLGPILEIAKRAGIKVIEDAAHALGARYGGKPMGAMSDYVIFSLQAIKHLTTIDGGMLACKNASDIVIGRKIRWFGIDRTASRTDVDIKIVGYKYHMNNVNATIGLVQLKHIDEVVKRHIENGRYFDIALRNIDGLRLCRWDSLASPSYWFYTILAEKRDELSKALTQRGVANSQVHKRNDFHSVFAHSKRELPGLDQYYSHMLHIPCGWWLSDEDREYIVESIKLGW